MANADVFVPHGSSEATINAGKVLTAMLVDDAVTTAKIADNAVTKATLAGSFLAFALIDGGAAGDHTVTGVAADDELVIVWEQDGTSGLLADLTSEFTISAADTINNDAGTATTSDKLIVVYLDLT